jgi:hypothetical protein
MCAHNLDFRWRYCYRVYSRQCWIVITFCVEGCLVVLFLLVFPIPLINVNHRRSLRSPHE